MKSIKTFIVAVALVAGGAVVLSSAAVLAADANSPASQMHTGLESIDATGGASFQDTVKLIINLFLFVIGSVAVLMIIYGGFKYVTSAGESSAVTSAKNTILYAVVGLVIAMLAYAITNFVVTTFDNNNGRTPDEQARYERCGNTPPSSCQ